MDEETKEPTLYEQVWECHIPKRKKATPPVSDAAKEEEPRFEYYATFPFVERT